MLTQLDPVDRITADAVGPPGDRVFYLQGRKDDRLITLLVEKQQVQLLAASVIEILARVGKETGEGPPEGAMTLEEPILPEWRAGRLSIGYLEDRDLLMLEAEELLPEDESGADEGDEGAKVEAEAEDDRTPLERELGVARLRDPLLPSEERVPGEEERGEGPQGGLDDLDQEQAAPQRVRFVASREQMLSLARHGAQVCAAGRPVCQLCGNPIGPQGHVCPALNGHRQSADE